MFDLEAELAKTGVNSLTLYQKDSLRKLEGNLATEHPENLPPRDFLLPLVKFGLSEGQIKQLLDKLPFDWPRDHREIFFDFRLDRWVKHVEPKNLAESMQDYLRSADSLEEGVLFVQKTLADLTRNWLAAE